jgi:hypothetical protein
MSKAVAFVVLLAVLCTVHAKVNFGSLVTPLNWHYIGRFCYSNINATGDYGANGSLNYTITTTNKNLTLLIYLDYDPDPQRDVGDWDTVYENDTMSCQEKQLRTIPGAIFYIPEGGGNYDQQPNILPFCSIYSQRQGHYGVIYNYITLYLFTIFGSLFYFHK